jgi:hypothetical protein
MRPINHVERWRERSIEGEGELEQIASEGLCEAAPGRILGVARAIYLHLTVDSRLWVRRGEFASVDREVLGLLL